MRRVFLETWRKAREGLPLEPLEATLAEVIAAHPEYHRALEDPEAVDRDYLPEGGESNPFLHLSLHLALAEQLAADRPAGIRDLFQSLAGGAADRHHLEHAVLECLAEALWSAQRAGRPPDEEAYLECVRRLRRGPRG
jgi:hypothetical protein